MDRWKRRGKSKTYVASSLSDLKSLMASGVHATLDEKEKDIPEAGLSGKLITGEIQATESEVK